MRARDGTRPDSLVPVTRSSTRRPIDAIAYPDTLERAEAALVARRRQHAGRDAGRERSLDRLPDDAVGFGLSGGGVRSATFALGVFQGLARAQLLRRIDFLSTVSGGGYFGSFLGRLFMRSWIAGPADVEAVLSSHEAGGDAESKVEVWGTKVFRWLRENGRYLAPRGSGDLLFLGALLLRNWVAIQAVLIISSLTLFSVAQFGSAAIARAVVESGWFGDVAGWLACRPVAGGIVLPSPWLITALIPLGLVVIPAGWSYWLVQRGDDGMRGVPAVIGAVLTTVLGIAGLVVYSPSLAQHPGRFMVCAAATLLSGLALIFYGAGEAWVRILRPAPGASLNDSGNRLRSGLTRLLQHGLVWCGGLLAFGLLDTAAGSVYATSETGDLWRWGTSLGGAFAAVGAFARPLYVLFAPRRRGARQRVPVSVVLWVAAVLVAGIWLIAVDVGSHGLRWALDAPHCVDGGPPSAVSLSFLAGSTIVLAAYTVLFGHTRRFLNLSSVHGFYTARLTRAFLGASNDARLTSGSSQVSGTERGDDCASGSYWHWPRPASAGKSAGKSAVAQDSVEAHPWEKGGPLHFINTTVNETVDASTGTQNQDRKGTGLAVGPCGLSLGIRHHLLASPDGWTVFPRDPHVHHVFTSDAPGPPEPMTLGRWTSISGAAFSTASGAMTTIPLALLCGLFNIRLGYWWNSNTGFKDRWLERVLPVQSALLAEMLARTHGTAGQLWNISDGGHFENMAGYELLRRRLPLVVIVDAEADPDYTFQGLSDLVRKARLDFEAEITFLSSEELDTALPASVRRYFGVLDALRRPLLESPSRAHAALARVQYEVGDHAFTSWLVYVKATLVGDEPEDVCHYHRAHPDFPQETTLDQFFDEAQWESYRRLGQHIAHRVLTPELFARLGM
jgi:hypothetical protein